MDGTYGTNGYELMLITVILIDEYGEGFPVAWCISNRKISYYLIIFNALKMRVGVIKPALFMSNLTEHYYTVLVSSFNSKLCNIVYIWHVDCAWREHLMELKDLELQAAVYHNLRVLMEETNKDKFEVLLDRTRWELLASAKTKSFGKDFENITQKSRNSVGCEQILH